MLFIAHNHVSSGHSFLVYFIVLLRSSPDAQLQTSRPTTPSIQPIFVNHSVIIGAETGALEAAFDVERAVAIVTLVGSDAGEWRPGPRDALQKGALTSVSWFTSPCTEPVAQQAGASPDSCWRRRTLAGGSPAHAMPGREVSANLHEGLRLVGVAAPLLPGCCQLVLSRELGHLMQRSPTQQRPSFWWSVRISVLQSWSGRAAGRRSNGCGSIGGASLRRLTHEQRALRRRLDRRGCEHLDRGFGGSYDGNAQPRCLSDGDAMQHVSQVVIRFSNQNKP